MASSTRVRQKLFFNTSMGKATTASMRRAAKRFVETADFVPALYWEGNLVNGHWQFKPCRRNMKRETE